MKKNFIKTINIFLILITVFGPLSVFATSTPSTQEQNLIDSLTPTPAPNTSNFADNLGPNASTQYTPVGNAYDPNNPWQYQNQGPNINTPITANNSYDAANSQLLNSNNVQKQINAIVANATSTATSSQSGTGGMAGQVGGCGAGQLLSNMITSSVSKAIGNKVQDAAGTLIMVPVSEQGIAGENIKAQTSASVGTVGIGGVLMAPGWNAVAYCIVNAMISYIADSTIQWINTGFDGNPAFLTNPDAFFKQLADEEAAAFIQNLAYGVSGGTNVCDVFREAMVRATLAQYAANQPYGYGYQNGGYMNRGLSNGFLGCTFDQDPNQLNSFLQGNFIQGGGWNSWYNLTQTPQGNPYDTLSRTSYALNSNINTAQASQARDLGWNNGFLNYTTCTNNPKTGNKQDCKTITPGQVIQGQLESTLNLPKQRLAFADKFDQVVTALVNQLINQALGKALQQNPTGGLQ